MLEGLKANDAHEPVLRGDVVCEHKRTGHGPGPGWEALYLDPGLLQPRLNGVRKLRALHGVVLEEADRAVGNGSKIGRLIDAPGCSGCAADK